MTTLPIDYTKRPWRYKYLTAETPVCNRWFIFGGKEGLVDIADPDGDVIVNVPLATAERIIRARDIFCGELEFVLGGK